MPTYQRAPDSVSELASRVLCKFPNYKDILDAKVRVDYIFAFAVGDEPAITCHGAPALGKCTVTKKLDRAKGMADVEIMLDANHWLTIDEEEQAAILDHELFHIELTGKKDDLGRPKIRMRPHDIEVGWFNQVAARHGKHSQERKQAESLMEHSGQYYWPVIHGFDEHGTALDNLKAAAKRLVGSGDVNLGVVER